MTLKRASVTGSPFYILVYSFYNLLSFLEECNVYTTNVCENACVFVKWCYNQTHK